MLSSRSYDSKFLYDVGLFIVLVAFVAWLYQLGVFDYLLKHAGQHFASKALQVPVTVGSARITIDGQLELHECVIHCAKDQLELWDHPQIIAVQRIRIACDPWSLLTKTWHFYEFRVEQITVHVQKKGGVLNVSAIGGPAPEPTSPAAQDDNASDESLETRGTERFDEAVPQEEEEEDNDSNSAAPSENVLDSGSRMLTGLFDKIKSNAQQIRKEVRAHRSFHL